MPLQDDIWLETGSPKRWRLDGKDVVAAVIILEERDEDITDNPRVVIIAMRRFPWDKRLVEIQLSECCAR